MSHSLRASIIEQNSSFQGQAVSGQQERMFVLNSRIWGHMLLFDASTLHDVGHSQQYLQQYKCQFIKDSLPVRWHQWTAFGHPQGYGVACCNSAAMSICEQSCTLTKRRLPPNYLSPALETPAVTLILHAPKTSNAVWSLKLYNPLSRLILWSQWFGTKRRQEAVQYLDYTDWTLYKDKEVCMSYIQGLAKKVWCPIEPVHQGPLVCRLRFDDLVHDLILYRERPRFKLTSPVGCGDRDWEVLPTCEQLDYESYDADVYVPSLSWRSTP